MISFGYLKLTFDISMAFIRYVCRLWFFARARFYHGFLRICFDNKVLLKQPVYINRGRFLCRQCDVSSYKYSQCTQYPSYGEDTHSRSAYLKCRCIHNLLLRIPHHLRCFDTEQKRPIGIREPARYRNEIHLVQNCCLSFL